MNQKTNTSTDNSAPTTELVTGATDGQTLIVPEPGDMQVTITPEILEMNPGLAEEGVKVGDEVTFGDVPTLEDALAHASATFPDHTIVYNPEEGRVYLIHKSTPEHLWEATNIKENLRKSDGRMGPHSTLLGTDEDLTYALLKATF